jgi:BirA family transcriptional regulator, biotin operon repressor / biotin---[acetyl-CoA-carboxylase] ligase
VAAGPASAVTFVARPRLVGVDGGPWQDLSRPPLREAALRRALVTPAGPYARIDVVPRAGSTNADLVAAAVADPGAWPDLAVLTTDHQDAGRGRLDRTWTTPPGAAVAVSVLLRPEVPPSAWGWLPLVAGTAVAEALQQVAGVRAGVKWPNDVLVTDPDGQERKVCGVLAEVVHGRRAPSGVVVGIGLNVTQSRDELPVPAATSLRLAGAATTDRDTVLRAVLRSFAVLYAIWSDTGGDVSSSGLGARVREACWTLGHDVRVDLPGGRVVAGTAEELDGQGRLVVRQAGGAVTAVAAGDVVHARPGP